MGSKHHFEFIPSFYSYQVTQCVFPDFINIPFELLFYDCRYAAFITRNAMGIG